MRTRDMSRAEFVAALKRNGFASDFGAWFKDTSGQAPGYSIGGVFTHRGVLLRRTTIAYLIERRKAIVAEIARRGW